MRRGNLPTGFDSRGRSRGVLKPSQRTLSPRTSVWLFSLRCSPVLRFYIEPLSSTPAPRCAALRRAAQVAAHGGDLGLESRRSCARSMQQFRVPPGRSGLMEFEGGGSLFRQRRRGGHRVNTAMDIKGAPDTSKIGADAPSNM